MSTIGAAQRAPALGTEQVEHDPSVKYGHDSSATLRAVESTALARAVAAHRRRCGEPDVIVRAPGRVNLIGEHTDYNEGFALPMALEFDTVVAVTEGAGADRAVTVVAEGFGSATFDPIDPTHDEVVPTWARHTVGVARDLGRLGVEVGGWDASVATDIPIGAGLSSSAALEVATTVALLHRAGVQWPTFEIARVGQRAENDFVGVPSGIMDQLISAGARKGHASLMDCRRMTLDHTPVPDGMSIAVLDTMTRRTLTDGAYSDRRRACHRAAAALGVAALRDGELTDLHKIASTEDRRRARHVITENERTLLAAAALRSGDHHEFGRLMASSHRSLRDDFEVSGPGLDAIVEVATRAPGCFGARMTGGGFAGCAVAAIDADAATAFVDAVVDGYRFAGHTARVWLSTPAAGASRVPSN